MIDLEKPVPAVATLACLVLVPNALGFGARTFPSLFRYLSRWIYPSARTELFSILGLILAFAFVFYLFLTTRSRSRALKQGPLRDPQRRFLPPLEIVLLQLGNFSFLVFALIVLVLAIGVLFSALRTAVDSPWLARHNFAVSFALVLTGTALLLPRTLRARSFVPLLRAWLPWATLCALALAVFGVIEVLGGWGPIQIHLAASVLQPRALGLLYVSLVVCLVLGRLLARAGRTRAAAAGSRSAGSWFVPSLVLAATAASGLSALFLHGVFLTLYGHLGDL